MLRIGISSTKQFQFIIIPEIEVSTDLKIIEIEWITNSNSDDELENLGSRWEQSRLNNNGSGMVSLAISIVFNLNSYLPSHPKINIASSN